MDKVNNLFGNVQMQKVSASKVEALGSIQDVYIAKVNNGTTDKICVIALAPRKSSSTSMSPLSQIDWSSLHVRSYKSLKQMNASLKTVASKEQLENLSVQQIRFPDWGNDEDVILTSAHVNTSGTTYQTESSLPFTITLKSVYTNNKRGNELETQIELIPALQTFNFVLEK